MKDVAVVDKDRTLVLVDEGDQMEPTLLKRIIETSNHCVLSSAVGWKGVTADKTVVIEGLTERELKHFRLSRGFNKKTVLLALECWRQRC